MLRVRGAYRLIASCFLQLRMSGKRKREAVQDLTVDDGGDGLPQFKKAVQDLKSKSQSKIANLTTMADKLYESADEVVKILSSEVANASQTRLQPLISVVDCILKKVGRDYKALMSDRIIDIVRTAFTKSDAAGRGWLLRMLNESWKKHEVLPQVILDQLSRIWEEGAPLPSVYNNNNSNGPTPTPSHEATPLAPPQPKAPLAKGQAFLHHAVKSEVIRIDDGPIPTATKQELLTPAANSGEPIDEELVERRLTILTKIMERKNPSHSELQEIMKVPEITVAISMLKKGQRQEAMTLLSRFKKDLEKKRGAPYRNNYVAAAVPAAPAAAPPAPVAAAGAAVPAAVAPPPPVSSKLPPQRDPRLSQTSQVLPPQPQMPPVDPRRLSASGAPPQPQPPPLGAPERERAPSSALPPSDPRQRGETEPSARPTSVPPASAMGASVMQNGMPMSTGALDHAAKNGISAQHLVPQERKSQTKVPSVGFSEAWLKQFMEQMPNKAKGPNDPKLAAPCVGRKVMGASGDQMVYVDELVPIEVLHLMQLIFLFEDRIRRGGGNVDLTQRIPHTFAYLQQDAPIDRMLRSFFDELPHQCTTTGVRFATREKMRKYHDTMYKRKSLAQQRARGAEARGWMESIPEWVGNRDLVVGPALFRLSEGSEEAQQREAAQPGQDEDGSDGEDEEDAWVCPADPTRSVCPISGEAFATKWSYVLNDWVYTDVVAAEPDSNTPIRFPTRRGVIEPIESRARLTETTVLFKKSCFFNTELSKRLEALRDCRSVHAIASASSSEPKAKVVRPEDPSLALLAAPRKLAKRF